MIDTLRWVTSRERLALLVVAGCLAGSGLAADEAEGADRGTRLEKSGMLVDTGGRSGACDYLAFDPAGTRLYAAGDDKVVRTWTLRGNDLAPADSLYWNTFRETRGTIYTAAMSHDPAAKLLAVGGNGRVVGDVVVFDRVSRRAVAALSAVQTPTYKASQPVWALAFDPASRHLAVGEDNGAVWVWDVKPGAGPHEVRRVCRPVAPVATVDSRVVWLRFDAAGRLHFARRSGEVFACDPSRADSEAKSFRLGDELVNTVQSSPDGLRLYAMSYRQRPGGGSEFAAYAADTGRRLGGRQFTADELPQRLAVDPAGRFVAVGSETRKHGVPFWFERPGMVYVLDAHSLATVSSWGLPTPPDAMAFHPRAKQLAVASGLNYGVALCSFEGAPKAEDTAAGVGHAIWNVRASADLRHLSIQTGHAAEPTHPNRRGTGPWHTFDLHERRWTNAQPPAPHAQPAGWSVKFDGPLKWTVVGPDGAWPLPWDGVRDDVPTCYSFLPPAKGHTRPRLAVGHYWGFSLFELDPQSGPRRVNRGQGHSGYVTAIAPAGDDGRHVVTCSRDQTVCLWRIDDWPAHPTLGASFERAGGRLVAKSIDAGSPAWEMELQPGDAVRDLWVKTAPVKPANFAAALAGTLTPGEEVALRVDRKGVADPVPMKTTMPLRPVWRFFPTKTDEWVLYRYHDYVYDCSANGDKYIGWLVGGATAFEVPTFLPAERVRRQLHKPELLAETLTQLVYKPGRPNVPNLQPPVVEVAASVVGKPAGGPLAAGPADTLRLQVTVRAAERTNALGQRGVEPLQRVRVLIGGDTLAFDAVPAANQQALYQATIDIKGTDLADGPNQVVVEARSRDLGRGDATVRVAHVGAGAGRARLFGVTVGIGNYRGSLAGRVGKDPNLLTPAADAEVMHESLTSQHRGALYSEANVVALTDGRATPAAILAEVERVGRAAGPNDLFVLLLAGHGMLNTPGTALGMRGEPAGEWFYVATPPGGQLKKTDDLTPAALTGPAILNKLEQIKCRKLVLLDCCHSGKVTRRSGARSLHDGNGPVVLAACEENEESLSGWPGPDGAKHGVFTAAVLFGLTDEFDKADTDHDKVLKTQELARYVTRKVEEDSRQFADAGDGSLKPHHSVMVPEKADPGFPVSGRAALARGRAKK